MNYYCIDNSIEEMMSRGSNCAFLNDEENLRSSWDQFSYHNGMYTSDVIKKWRSPHIHEANQLLNNMNTMSDEFLHNRFVFTMRQEEGDEIDIGRFVAYSNGETDDNRYWSAMRRKPKKAQAVRVYAPIGGIGSVSSKEMLVCGAIAASVVEKLESEGIAVELWCACMFRVRCTENNVINLVKIKSSEEYSDLGMIAYICGNEEVYRNIMWKERISFAKDLKRSGIKIDCHYYDPGCYASESFTKSFLMPEEGYDNTIVIPRIYDMYEAKGWLENFANNNNNSNNE